MRGTALARRTTVKYRAKVLGLNHAHTHAEGPNSVKIQVQRAFTLSKVNPSQWICARAAPKKIASN
jgi:hypothetical protein